MPIKEMEWMDGVITDSTLLQHVILWLLFISSFFFFLIQGYRRDFRRVSQEEKWRKRELLPFPPAPTDIKNDDGDGGGDHDDDDDAEQGNQPNHKQNSL